MRLIVFSVLVVVVLTALRGRGACVIDRYVLKRPGCDEFLRDVGALFEVVVFTASLAKARAPPARSRIPHACTLTRARTRKCKLSRAQTRSDSHEIIHPQTCARAHSPSEAHVCAPHVAAR